mgnify:FL=1
MPVAISQSCPYAWIVDHAGSNAPEPAGHHIKNGRKMTIYRVISMILQLLAIGRQNLSPM